MKKILAIFLVVFGLLLLGGSVAQSTRTTVDLSSGPIINSANVSNLALVLSVEFPTVGAAYRSGTYDSTKKYLGYFNSNSCYGYNGTSADGFYQPNSPTDSSYFCNTGASGVGTGFSGNFLNFAATSAIDIVRFALTGGDRFVDETGPTGRTILQRAVLPGGADVNGSFYGSSSNFPTRSLTAGTLTARVTPFGASTAVFVNSCFDNIFFGTATSTRSDCAPPASNANLTVTNTISAKVVGAFKARVLVCSSTEGPSRTDLCKQYPSGNYKPVGEIQKNSDKVRVAAFGYLLDQVNTRYGGVLRAPMKFAGPNQKDANGIVSPNDTPEWGSDDGVFVFKPINTSNEAGYTYTGVINYLNTFGRNQGIYKRFDPVGELYYESLRYFQGKQPTSSATTSLTAANLNGYPVYTTWSDPMQNSCQRNYAMVVGDNNTHVDGQIPGSTINQNGYDQRRAADGTGIGGLNADTWTRVVESFETNGSVSYVDAQGVTRTANGNSVATTGTNTGVQTGNTNLATKATGSDNASYLWAGAAYWANTQSIRADKPLARVRTFVIDVDEGGNGDINNTSGIAVRQRAFYLAGKYGGFADIGPDQSSTTGDGSPFKTYVSGSLTASTKEWLAIDGSASPVSYFLASQPERMVLAIRKIFAEASKATGNLAGGALSVPRLNKTSSTGAFYTVQNDVSDWSGTIVRTEINFNTTTQATEFGSTVTWSASKILTGDSSASPTVAPFPLPANRNIISYSSMTSTLAGITFTWASTDPAVKTALMTDPATSIVGTTTDGQNRLNYIRGDRSNEGDFRARAQLMGDIINSGPVVKGAPASDILDSSYQSFYASNQARTPTLYVGSNDGMLHAFKAGLSATDTTNGQELFAYVPRAISLKLNKLTNPAYVKEAFVDSALSVNEARLYKSATATVDWGTVLASGMGGGAQGLFALDVTNPTTFSKNNVLWEFTDADDADMGNLIAEPKIVKLNMNAQTSGTPDYRWFVMATSGYNNYQTDSFTSSSTGQQFLFLLSLEKAPGTAWSLGSNYFKIGANNTTFTSTTAATGMGMPNVARGVAGEALYAYAGDLQGNMWKFDLTGGSSTWTGTSKAKVLFIAKDSAGNTQPITVIPLVGLNVVSGYQLTFGTGKFIEPKDSLAVTAQVQTIYSVWDAQDNKTVNRIATGSGSSSVNGLTSRTITITPGTTTISVTGTGFQYGVNSASYRGWYADLTNTMERIAVDPSAGSGVVSINSTIPGGDPCVSTGGAKEYRLNAQTGLSLVTVGQSTVSGYLGTAAQFESGDAIWSTRSSSGRYTVTRKSNTASSGSGGGTSVQSTTVTSIAGRISWREITNFQ
ncbi:pilus assembly protein [Polaromonas sp.]|uniref:pilus assembly protein n=1 Tax=Polaromonas sp. TaxID=1869339 RepID=UPI003BAC8EBB